MPKSMRREIEAAATALNTDRKGLARHLGLSVASLRSWEARGGPGYARLALAAIVMGVEPDEIFSTVERAGKDLIV
jgi:hypothetical protein